MTIMLSRSKYLKINNNTPEDVILFLLQTTGKNIEKEKIEKKFDKIKKHILEH